MALLRDIRRRLYEDGYTIRGVQNLLSGNAAPERPGNHCLDRTTLEAVRSELREARALLDRLLNPRSGR
jgi:hypothetical protein